MYPHTHFLFPFTIALVLNRFSIISWKLTVLCGIVGVIIDIDHFIDHIVQAKGNKFSIKATWNNSVRFHRFDQRTFIHHWKGAILVTTIIGSLILYNWQVSLIIALGYYSHLLLDYIHVRKDKSVRIRLKGFFIKEYYSEILLDLSLIATIIVLLII
ncbi:hypothetical protein COY27_01890 [Candidatus Woesearchaeota archaeon CG_4_10_14_0_2_um_filter_33_13]|nr:MAG: hypothetical protein COY27_01890 [Candidatus Woesearchaeota archaeon CG_4_10_14_0_2_um_filter_33_13]